MKIIEETSSIDGIEATCAALDVEICASAAPKTEPQVHSLEALH